MVSASFFCLRREMVWQVVHDSSKSPTHLGVSGKTPPEYPSIRDGLLRKQAGPNGSDVDYVFDVPIDLAEAVTGYRHDRWRYPWGEITYTIASPKLRQP